MVLLLLSYGCRRTAASRQVSTQINSHGVDSTLYRYRCGVSWTQRNYTSPGDYWGRHGWRWQTMRDAFELPTPGVGCRRPATRALRA